MKCIHCGKDSKHSERTDGRCPCGKKFAFEPKNGDPFTDRGFQSAIESVSAKGQVRWGVEHLYYELCRRSLRKRMLGWKIFVIAAAVVPVLVMLVGGVRPAAFALLAWLAIAGFSRRHRRPPIVTLDQATFDGLWQRWVQAHGSPQALIVRKPERDVPKAREADIGDYSFDRAVICDRARTVDLLIANNFHFENSCAVLSIGGYPRGPFETVRTMLKRNPKLQVFALHDASLAGCELAYTLTNDPLWFQGQATVTDVGLRPRHAGPFVGLFLPPSYGSAARAGQGITADELTWLNTYTLELAAIRPEQVLKRLFRAINRKEDSSSGSGDGGGGGTSTVSYDEQSFSSDAGDSDGGADSFG